MLARTQQAWLLVGMARLDVSRVYDVNELMEVRTSSLASLKELCDELSKWLSTERMYWSRRTGDDSRAALLLEVAIPQLIEKLRNAPISTAQLQSV